MKKMYTTPFAEKIEFVYTSLTIPSGCWMDETYVVGPGSVCTTEETGNKEYGWHDINDGDDDW